MNNNQNRELKECAKILENSKFDEVHKPNYAIIVLMESIVKDIIWKKE